jgi:hypothetical protein
MLYGSNKSKFRTRKRPPRKSNQYIINYLIIAYVFSN